MRETYQLIDSPTNGTTGQDCGVHAYDDLPAHVRAAIDAEPFAGEWTLPALSDGDSGEPLNDLVTVVRRRWAERLARGEIQEPADLLAWKP